MSRRLAHMRGNWTFVTSLVLISMFCHSTWPIYDRLTVSLFPISLIITIYLGYKAGPWVGLFSGFISGLPATIMAWNLDRVQTWQLYIHARTRSGLDGDIWEYLDAFSLEALIIITAIGFLSGYLVEKFEAFLNKNDLSFDYLFPSSGRKSILVFIVSKIGRWVKPWRNSKEYLEQVGGSINDEAQPVDSPRGMNRAMHKAMKNAIFMKAALLSVFLNVVFVFGFEGFRFYLFPYYTSVFLVIVVAFFTSSKAGVLLAFVVYAVANFLWFEPDILNFYELNTRGKPSILSPSQFVGLSILAWWGGKFGEMYRDDEKRDKVSVVWKSYCCHDRLKEPPSDLIVVLLILLGLSLWLSFPGGYLSYQPYFALLALGAVYASCRDAWAVSNRIIIFTLILSVVRYKYGFSLAEDYSLSIGLSYGNAVIAILLGVFVLLAGHLDLKQKSHCRIIVYGFLISLLLMDIYLKNANFTLMFKLAFYIKHHSVLLAWVLQLLFAELIVFLVNAIAQKQAHISGGS